MEISIVFRNHDNCIYAVAENELYVVYKGKLDFKYILSLQVNVFHFLF